MAMTLGEIAVRFGLELAGDPGQSVDGVASLARRRAGQAQLLHRREVPQAARRDARDRRRAAARARGGCPVAALVSARPYAAWARIANGLHPPAAVRAGRAPGAQVDPSGRGRRLRRGSGRTPSSAPAPSSASAARSDPTA